MLSSLRNPGAEYEPLDYLTRKELVALCDSFVFLKSENKLTLIKNIWEYHISIASVDTAEEETTAQRESDEDLRSNEGEYSSKMSEGTPNLHQSEDKEVISNPSDSSLWI